MIHNLRTAKIFWAITAGLALIAAIGGAVSPAIYDGLVPKEFLPGTLPQDLLIILQAIALFVLIAKTDEGDVKKQVVSLGLLGAFFYFYGILTIERTYNAYYLMYAAVFASSFWSIVYSLAGCSSDRVGHVHIGKGMLRTSAIVSLVIAVVFTVVWIAVLIPLMQAHDRIDYFYSIYILDLCFVMPAFFIVAIMSLRKLAFGILLLPAILILGFFVIFPLGLNEAAKPASGMEMNVGPLVLSFLFAAVMLVIAIAHLRAIRVGGAV